jgi:hypothetical protein
MRMRVAGGVLVGQGSLRGVCGSAGEKDRSPRCKHLGKVVDERAWPGTSR